MGLISRLWIDQFKPTYKKYIKICLNPKHSSGHVHAGPLACCLPMIDSYLIPLPLALVNIPNMHSINNMCLDAALAFSADRCFLPFFQFECEVQMDNSLKMAGLPETELKNH